MRLARRIALSVLPAAGLLAASFLTPLAPAEATTPPTVSLSGPATATGVATFAADGEVDPGDTAVSLTLLVNGVQYGASKACVAVGAQECPTTFSWDSSALNGSYTLSARLVWDDAGSTASTTDSVPVTVVATNPAPVVAITAPTAGGVIHNPLLVVVQGSVDLSQTDTPQTLQLWVDGVKYGLPTPCTVVITTSKACSGSFTVNEPAWSGDHSLQVTMATTLTSATSATVPYTIFTATRTQLDRVATLHSGRSTGIGGSVTSVSSGAGVAGALVKLTLTPAVGKAHSIMVHTGASGHYSTAVRVGVDTTVVASVAGNASTGGSHASTKISVLAPIVCKVTPRVRHGVYDDGVCTIANLPRGTRITLQYLSHKQWKTLGAGTNSGAAVPIHFTFGARGTYSMRLVVGASKAYLSTYGTPFVVKVS